MSEDAIQPAVDVTHEIVGRINGGDADAWNDLWTRLHDDLLFAVRCRLGPGLRRHLESEDILQSVAMEAFHELPRFVPRGSGSLRHFLHVLVSRKIKDRAAGFGAEKRRGTRPMDDHPPTPAAPCYRDTERYERLETVMGALPPDMRDVLVLHRLDGLPSKEVAERMGRTDAAVRKLYSRALGRMRELLSEFER